MATASSSFTRVGVSGIGPLSAAGAGGAALLESFEARRTPVARFDPRTEGVPGEPFPLYRAPSDALDALLTERDRCELPRDPELRLAVAALREALRDAGLDGESMRDAAIVLTWETPGLDRLQRGLMHDWLERAAPPRNASAPADARFREFYARHREAFYSTHSFLHLHLVARALGVHGPGLILNNACASGLYALEAARDLLALGKAEIALVAAAECPTFPTKMLWFDEQGLYARDGRLRPFDRDRQGLVLGEAGAALVLETLEHARARGARVYAEYLGGHVEQEAWKVAVPDLSQDHYGRAILGACRRAGVSPADIDAVLIHGAGTVLSDLQEARGLTAVWGDWPERPEVLALKPYFGHTLGASALLETCGLLACMRAGKLPSTPGSVVDDPKLKVRPRRHAGSARIETALKMANGFAGFHAGAVFRRPSEAECGTPPEAGEGSLA